MKQKVKLSFFQILNYSGFFIFVILGLLIFAKPTQVFGQVPTVGLNNQCTSSGSVCPPTVVNGVSAQMTCSQGFICDPQTCICALSIGTPCSASPNSCQSGSSCVPGNVNGNTTSICTATNSQNPGAVASPPSNNTPSLSGSTTACPAGLSPNPNGLCVPPNQFPNGIAGSTTLVGLLLTVIQFLLFFAGVVAVIIVILGGYWYMTASGNEEQSEKGKKTIINFVLGLIIIIMGYAIVNILFNTLTTTSLTNSGSSYTTGQY